ncbi:MAG: hypothetical protein A3B86_02235 [Candidatus Yanofskybacteria bacterium RIFCSPHIGHO2_02_FULL_38_22b]|uniref:Uncharacterized protein n=1 Tax=Candidatus Yanofskybacteria bacterium RIFCSPHIGHO2_02_FULL_38_22b TaxID=1802673 RepID=A0A1F8F3B5_9BACT|nr:MAG: hypothetical protein A3B86_02235 [Candidatus Yanofskybacteria bacterium RIFCSPHIGHO2_02_FULL_38_22b]OGN20267.1 MAG: hypothetical protein A2910_03070 [Candidatus Yanofskybacteria bacterium RIFCSPLOWO2_01_FULL_39_28]
MKLIFNKLKHVNKTVFVFIFILIGVNIFLFVDNSKTPSAPVSNAEYVSGDIIFDDMGEKRARLFEMEDRKILSSEPEELNDEQICTNIGYLLASYCGSGGCSLSQPLEEWIDKAQHALRLRGITAYESKDSDIHCSEAVVGRIDNIFETAKKK